MRLAGCTPIEVQEHAEEEMKIEKEEAARVLYVAATRARDLLVVCGVGDLQYDGWLAALNPVIYPAMGTSFNPITRQPAGCPEFGDDTVLFRPTNAFRPQGSVSPGLHRPEWGDHQVVWWDPATLGQEKPGTGGSRLTEFLKEDVTKIRSLEGIRAHQEWRARRGAVRETGALPEWKVVTATAHALESSVETELPYEVTLESLQIDFSRPHGKRFGTLVHAVLSIVALDADRNEIEKAARLQGRILGSTEDEITSASETVTRALRNPIMIRAAEAAKAGKCRREVPIVVKMEGGEVVEGIVDLAFEEKGAKDGRWTIIDYKTDFELEGKLEEYRHQVGLYALAVSEATGRETRAVLLRI
jgi:ATP-dependent exoDNAse (exonuclease V) beta subunit